MPSENRQPTPFGKFIKQRREALELTLEEVAKRLTNAGWKTSFPTIAHWESASDPVMPKDFFNPRFIKSLSTALETSPVVIMHESGMFEGIDDIQTDDPMIASMLNALKKMSPDNLKLVYEIVQRFSTDK